jgi:hypothetical protein
MATTAKHNLICDNVANAFLSEGAALVNGFAICRISILTTVAILDKVRLSDTVLKEPPKGLL